MQKSKNRIKKNSVDTDETARLDLHCLQRHMFGFARLK